MTKKKKTEWTTTWAAADWTAHIGTTTVSGGSGIFTSATPLTVSGTMTGWSGWSSGSATTSGWASGSWTPSGTLSWTLEPLVVFTAEEIALVQEAICEEVLARSR